MPNDLNQGAITDTGSEDVNGITQDTGSEDVNGTTEDVGSEIGDEIDVDSLTAEELEKIDLSKFEVDEEEGSEESVEDEEETEPEPEKPEGKTGDPLKDTKAALTREQQRRAELERKLAEMEERLRQLQKPAEFEELTEEELEELKYDDPDAYVQYMLDKERYEQQKQEYEAQTQQVIFQRQANELAEFAQDIGVNINDQAKLQEFLNSDDMKTLAQFVTDTMKPDENGIYTKDRLAAAWKALKFDTEVQRRAQEEKQKAAQQTVEQIQRAQKGGSALDRVGRGDTTPPKTFNQMTPEEIDQLSEEEVEQYLRELEQEALSQR